VNDPRVEALGRLGGPVVECAACSKKVLEHESFYLRRLWIDKEADSRTKAERIMFYACSRECAGRLETNVRDAAREHEWDSALWIDDSHVIAANV
jgi:hypothetical protein